jgi:predicted transcriptional regulator
MKEKTRINVMLGKDQLAELRRRLEVEDTTVSQLLRRLIDEYLKQGRKDGEQ